MRQEPRPPCTLSELPPRPRTLGGEPLPDGRLSVSAETLAALNLWMSAAYQRMLDAEACL